MIDLYWDIGRLISERQQSSGGGDELIEEIGRDLARELERDLQRGLVQHLTSFMLELGKGFAFVGREYHVEVSGQDFYIGLLFYHLKLHCYVAIELKTGPFKPEYAGKLNFYPKAFQPGATRLPVSGPFRPTFLGIQLRRIRWPPSFESRSNFV